MTRSQRSVPVRVSLAAVAVFGLLASGCAPASQPSVTPAVSGTPSVTAPQTSAAPTSAAPATTAASSPTGAAPTSAAPSAPPGPSVKATGKLSLFSEASDALAGTCQVVGGVPRLALTDKANDFYDTIAVSIDLSADRAKVAVVAMVLGEDSEGISRVLSHPAKGSSATVAVKGNRITVKGKLRVTEDGVNDGGVLPFTATVSCGGSW